MTDMIEIKFRGKTVTRQHVLDAIRKFDWKYPDTSKYRNWLKNDFYKTALDFNGKLYPPKIILNIATEVGLDQFTGGVGSETYKILTKLGFVIIEKPNSPPKK